MSRPGLHTCRDGSTCMVGSYRWATDVGAAFYIVATTREGEATSARHFGVYHLDLDQPLPLQLERLGAERALPPGTLLEATPIQWGSGTGCLILGPEPTATAHARGTATLEA